MNAPPGTAFNSLLVNASAGHQTSNTCSATMANEANYGMAIAGIGVNAITYNLYKNSINNAGSLSLSYNVITSNSFTVIMGANGWYGGGSVTPPSGCISNSYAGNYSNAYVGTCQNQAAGSYTVNANDGNATTSFALAAYVFPPKNVILDDNPTTGTITTNGNTYTNGQTMQVIGTNTITANPPITGNWIFNSWSVSNSLNLTIANTISSSTSLTVMGGGTVTAAWNGISKFIESGLPSATTWNVVYNSVLNSSATNTIVFSTDPGNYLFTVANQIVSGTTYVPTPSTGYLIAGNSIQIAFSTVSNSCQISLSPSALNFGLISPGTSSLTANQIVDTNSGSASAYMYVYGGNWISGTQSFGVSNTSWSSSSGIAYAGASKLGPAAANTLIGVASSSSNSVYFGLNIPAAQPADTYNQIITIENSC